MAWNGFRVVTAGVLAALMAAGMVHEAMERSLRPALALAGADGLLDGAWLGALLIGAAQAQDASPAFEMTRSGEADGRMAVLIPGLASSGAVWDTTADALGGYDVRTLTLAGFAGAAPRPEVADGAPVIAGAAQAIADMLEREGAEDAALVGHSLGAQVALQAAALAPDRVSQVVVVDSPPFYAGLVQPGTTPDQAAAFADAARAQLSAMPEPAFRAQQAAGMAIYSKDRDYVQTLVGWLNASDQATVVAGFAEIAGGDFRPVLAEVEAETLVLAAWDPAMGRARDALESAYRDQYAGAPDAEVRMIDDSFHFIMHDQPEAFLDALTAFLDGGAQR